MRNKIILVAAAATTSLALASPAFGATTGPEESARAAKVRTDLTLGYMAEAGYAAAVRLTCTAGDVHPQAVKACVTLKKAGGDPAKIIPAKTMCTMEYAPITASATGTFMGKKVSWTKKFGNQCVMRQETGVLFAF